MDIKPVAALALAGLLIAGTLGTAHAASQDEEATALQGAKVSLVQAIAAAEQQTGGRAFDAGADRKGGTPRITVETNGPEAVRTTVIDAQNGQASGTRAGGGQD